MKTIQEMAREAGAVYDVLAMGRHDGILFTPRELEVFAALVREDEREAIYGLVMEAPFKEFDRQEEEFDGEAANAMKAMAFSLTSAIRARSNT